MHWWMIHHCNVKSKKDVFTFVCAFIYHVYALKVSDFKRKSIHVSGWTRMKTTFETWKNILIQRLSNLISLALVWYHLSRVEIIHLNWKLNRICKQFMGKNMILRNTNIANSIDAYHKITSFQVNEVSYFVFIAHK